MRERLVTAAFGLSLVLACNSGGEPTCTPGAQVSCACIDNAKGAQVCNADGTFSPCECGSGSDGGDAGVAGDATTEASTPPSCEINAPGVTCNCENPPLSSESTSTKCTPTAIGSDAYCCTYGGWPDVGGNCYCTQPYCDLDPALGGECYCEWGASASAPAGPIVASCTATSGSICCLDPRGSCDCFESSCDAPSVQVAACTQAAMQAAACKGYGGGTLVATCSP